MGFDSHVFFMSNDLGVKKEKERGENENAKNEAALDTNLGIALIKAKQLNGNIFNCLGQLLFIKSLRCIVCVKLNIVLAI